MRSFVSEQVACIPTRCQANSPIRILHRWGKGGHDGWTDGKGPAADVYWSERICNFPDWATVQCWPTDSRQGPALQLFIKGDYWCVGTVIVLTGQGTAPGSRPSSGTTYVGREDVDRPHHSKAHRFDAHAFVFNGDRLSSSKHLSKSWERFLRRIVRCGQTCRVRRRVQYHTSASSTFVHLLLGGVALREYVHISQVADTVLPVLLCRVEDGWNTIMITSTVNRTSRPGTHCHNSHRCQLLPIVSMRSERLSHTLTARSRTTNVAGHEQSLDDVLLHSYY